MTGTVVVVVVTPGGTLVVEVVVVEVVVGDEVVDEFAPVGVATMRSAASSVETVKTRGTRYRRPEEREIILPIYLRRTARFDQPRYKLVASAPRRSSTTHQA